MYTALVGEYLLFAFWNTWVVVLLEVPTSSVTVVGVTAVILTEVFHAGSLPDAPFCPFARGYEWSELWPSWSQRNTSELLAILTAVPAVKLWLPIVTVRSPVPGTNDASVTSNPLIGDLPTLTVITPDCLLIPFVAAFWNTCVVVSDEVPTLTSNVSLVLLEICNHLP